MALELSQFVKRSPSASHWSHLTWSKMFLEPRWRACFQARQLDTVRRIMSTDQATVVADDPSESKNDVLRLEIQWEGRLESFYIKRYYNYRFNKIWKRAFRGSFFPPSMVKREYDNIQRLSRAGFDVPEMVGYGELRLAGAVVAAVLISREIPNAMGLDYALSEWLPKQLDPVRANAKTTLLIQLADLTRRMHALGFEHHDYFLRNLVISNTDCTRIFILDCPRALRWPKWAMPRRCVHDLATLDAAAAALFRRSERLRFFLRYRGRARLDASDKSIIARILTKAEPWRDRQTDRLKSTVHVSPTAPV